MKQLAVFFFVVIIAFLISCQPAQKKFTIGYVQITEDPVLEAAKNGVFHALADSGFTDGINIQVINKNAQGNLSMISAILQSFISQNVDLIITNSTPCMAAAAQLVHNIPVVFTVSYSPEQIGMKMVPDNIFGVYDSLRADEFTDLVTECMPGLKRIGMPYNNAEQNAEYSARILENTFSQRGIDIVKAPVNSVNDILQAGQYLSGKQIDAFVVSADNTVYLGLPVLTKLASENKIPLFVTDPMQTEKGAAVGFGCNYEKWGYQSGLKAVMIIKNKIPSVPIETMPDYELTINLKSCALQGISLSEKIIARANRTIN
jgi:putative tryptophan/tyrosine transport system substrate-binding protein